MTHLARDLRIALDPALLLREAGLQPDPFQEQICRSDKDMLVLASRQGARRRPPLAQPLTGLSTSPVRRS